MKTRCEVLQKANIETEKFLNILAAWTLGLAVRLIKWNNTSILIFYRLTDIQRSELECLASLVIKDLVYEAKTFLKAKDIEIFRGQSQGHNYLKANWDSYH